MATVGEAEVAERSLGPALVTDPAAPPRTDDAVSVNGPPVSEWTTASPKGTTRASVVAIQ